MPGMKPGMTMSAFRLSRPPPLRLPERPVDDVILVFFERHLALEACDAPAHGNARLHHGFGAARDERVPPGKPPSLGETAIGAGMRQPAVFRGALRRELQTIGHAGFSVFVIL